MPQIPDLPPVHCQPFTTPSGITAYFAGPPLSDGPLPTLLYFCATAQESLCVDPYNQPVAFLQYLPLRIFSMTLPLHTPGADNRRSVGLWAKEFALNRNPLEALLLEANDLINHLVEIGMTTTIASGGLSRGGLVATHLAAQNPHIQSCVGFAPLTDLFCLEEFAPMRDNPLVNATILTHSAENLIGKPLRFYIGNRDMRVSTDACYTFVRHLTELSYSKGKRSPPVELILTPSIGHLGHGTSPQTFLSGARWIAKMLGLNQGNQNL